MAAVAPAASQGTVSNPVAPNYGKSQIRTTRFNAGVGTGTVRQIGLCADSLAASLFCVHVLPVPVIKAANQVLDVLYRITVYPSLISNTVSAVIGGVTYDCVSSFYDVGANDNTALFNEAAVLNSNAFCAAFTGPAAGLLDSLPSGTSTYVGSASNYNYLAGRCDFTTFYNLNQANYSPPDFIRTSIAKIAVGGYRIQTEFTATDGPNIGQGIPKDYRYELSLNRRLTWGRYTP